MKKLFILSFLLLTYLSSFSQRRLELLFLGDNGHHKPFDRYPALQAYLGVKGMNITYSSSLKSLNTPYLNKFDGVILFANHDSIAAPQEKALIDYVSSGHGLIAIHCASFNFRNSKELVKMMGGQFWRHTMDSIRVQNTLPQHPILKDYEEIKTVDETYLHKFLQPDNVVIQSRIIGPDQAKDKPGQSLEPYTWVRTYGKGNVFYTAFGHDERTWNTTAFQHLIEQGILWAVGPEKRELVEKLNLPTLKYRLAELPNYEKRLGPQVQQLPLTPEESMKFIQVPVDFNLQLFSSEPNVMHPIAMAWDEKGRLYVLITKDYPNERKKSGGSDYILLCEDTNNDGKADKFTKWAEGLSIPTGMVFANGGLLVSQAPDMVFLKDTNGDDVADERKVLFTGFGTGDTHAGPSNLHYGFDNWIYACIGYSGFKGKVGADSLNFAQAFFRFKPDGSKMEHLTQTSNNTWGFDINEEGDIFGSTANNSHGWYMPIPHRNIWQAPFSLNGSKNTDTHKDIRPITSKVRQVDVFGGFTAASGHNFYSARSFPKNYWNKIAFVTEPTGHIVHQNNMVKTGSDYMDKEGFNLMAGADEWFSPVFAQVGPDGAVWVADWYSYIIQHNPVPRGFVNGTGNAYETNLRDYTHGRIYRVGWNQAPKYSPISLSKDNVKANLAALSNNNLFWRLTAQRLLVERGKQDIVPALLNLIQNKSVDGIGINPGAIHALHVLQGLNALENKSVEATLKGALKHPSAAVRKNAVQVLPRNLAWSKAILEAKLLNDKDTLVQLNAILALSEMPSNDKADQAVAAKIKAEQFNADRWIPDALAAYEMSRGKENIIKWMKAKGQEKAKLAAEKEAKEVKNPSVDGQENGLDLVVEDVIIKSGVFKLREGSSFVIKVKNRGNVALEKGTVLPLSLTIEGQGSKIEMESYTFTDGILPGQSGIVTKNTNGPWTGNFGWTAEQPGNYVMAISIDRAAILKESNRNNNQFRKNLMVNAGLNLDAYITEKMFRGAANAWSGAEIAGILQEMKDPGSVGMMGALKGLANAWNSKKEANLDANQKAFVVSLAKQVEPGQEAYLNRLAELWKVDLPNQEQGPVVKIFIKTVKEEMKFDQKTFEVPAGVTVELVLENVDAMQHNLVIGQIGSMEKIGAAADKMITAADAVAKNYVPNIPEIIAYTPLVDPDGRVKLRFKAPNTPGDYPFVCTFPGHWRIMNGVMKVK
ncbi:dehydrogenase [Sandaracinomonas limnophila]|uniref:Dehydrogenase n=1 Tax=Sandaracinomonas limnophila TaxID=1862386 RepID=A0A437PPJ5_9BACT|nr:PVC-type heme-binding CxxCH protein [Sandaracinomonas limnophila]RVU24181.1 dehydrogenase [Sandaracinomonas limnophila]